MKRGFETKIEVGTGIEVGVGVLIENQDEQGLIFRHASYIRELLYLALFQSQLSLEDLSLSSVGFQACVH